MHSSTSSPPSKPREGENKKNNNVNEATSTISRSTTPGSHSVPGKSGGGGGVWEVVLDHASLQVAQYLTSRQCGVFDPSSDVAAAMLRLLDRSTLMDIITERNYDGMCGRFGCLAVPRGLHNSLAPPAAATASNSSGGGAGSASLQEDWRKHIDWSGNIDEDEDEDEEEEQQGDMVMRKGVVAEAEAGGGCQTRARSRSSGGRGNSTLRYREDDHNGEAEGDQPYRSKHLVKFAPEESEVEAAARVEEIVYDEDVHTLQSFRLAERDMEQLRRVRARATRKQQTRKSASSARISAPLRESSTKHVLTFPERFCSDICLDVYASDIKPRVSAYLEYGHPDLIASVSCLFPNLRLDVLQQLAKAETTGGPLMGEIQEKNATPDGVMRMTNAAAGSIVGGGTETEAAAETATVNNEKRPSPSTTVEAVQPQLQWFLNGMREMRQVWRSALLSPSPIPTRLTTTTAAAATLAGASRPSGNGSRHHRSTTATNTDSIPANRPNSEAKEKKSDAPEEVEEEQEEEEEDPRVPGRPALIPGRGSSGLRGAILVMDFLMNTCGVRCGQIFLAHYAVHRTALKNILHRHTSVRTHPPSQEQIPAFEAVALPLLEALEAKLLKEPPQLDVTEPLRVEGGLEQQRRAQLAHHLFSVESTSTLSRLLLLDEDILSASAWNGLWLAPAPQAAAGGASGSSFSSLGTPHVPRIGATTAASTPTTFNSLVFPFSIPSLVLRPLHSSPESLTLALVFVVAAACVHPAVLAEFLEQDAEIDEVLDAVRVNTSEVKAAVRMVLNL